LSDSLGVDLSDVDVVAGGRLLGDVGVKSTRNVVLSGHTGNGLRGRLLSDCELSNRCFLLFWLFCLGLLLCLIISWLGIGTESLLSIFSLRGLFLLFGGNCTDSLILLIKHARQGIELLLVVVFGLSSRRLGLLLLRFGRLGLILILGGLLIDESTKSFLVHLFLLLGFRLLRLFDACLVVSVRHLLLFISAEKVLEALDVRADDVVHLVAGVARKFFSELASLSEGDVGVVILHLIQAVDTVDRTLFGFLDDILTHLLALLVVHDLLDVLDL
jgi:hypothetical protein